MFSNALLELYSEARVLTFSAVQYVEAPGSIGSIICSDGRWWVSRSGSIYRARKFSSLDFLDLSQENGPGQSR